DTVAGIDGECRRLALARGKRHANLRTSPGAEYVYRLVAAQLGGHHEDHLPSVPEIGNDAGLPVGSEGGIAVDQRHDAQWFGLEEEAAAGYGIATDVQQGPAPGVGPVADIVGFDIVV